MNTRNAHLPLSFLCSTMAATLVLLAAGAGNAATYSWQLAHAKVTPEGDLQWAPQPFVFAPGASVKYIDYAQGNDANDGSKEKPWQHHPWDKTATANAAACTGIHTYVFKRGVVYRGALMARDEGAANNPIQLTSDPSWGTGEAVISGSVPVRQWTRGANGTVIPEAGKVWHADLDCAPRAVWMIGNDGASTRLKLARTPNWRASDPDDVMSEWWTWENPFWWRGTGHVATNSRGVEIHMGIDTKNLTGAASNYVGGLVWSEWGIVMGAPYAAPIETYDAAQKGIGFQGPWMGTSEKIMTGCKYSLEDLPQFLDEPGEYWFDKQGQGGRLYVRLPGEADPNTVTIEAARHINLLDAASMNHVRISGLTFRFNNLYWDLSALGWQHPDVENAAIRLVGTGNGITIDHCKFLDTAQAIRLQADNDGTLDAIEIADNEVVNTDHGGIEIRASRAGARTLGAVRVLRNRLANIGFRPARPNGHMALTVAFPQTAEIAGNFIARCGGSGIFTFGAKGSGSRDDVPFSRFIIHHNKVVDPLLIANDWGGIETWQGGPTYVFGNISGNPGGLMHFKTGNKAEGTPRFGHAYYLDGAFKNYHFNNIAWGKNNELGSKYANCAAFQEIISYQNTFFNNTVYKFVVPSRRQAPQAGRDKFMGNIFDDVSQIVFRHSDAEGKDPNARDAGGQATAFAYETDAYTSNIFHDLKGKLGVFEAAGGDYPDVASFSAALQARKALAAGTGVLATNPVLRNAANHDFRLAPGSAAIGAGVKVFVPWSLYAVVGEWNFTRNNLDPASVIDEHWYMTPYYIGRDDYYKCPMYPLTVVGVTADKYVNGPLEDWTQGALELNGKDTFLTIRNADLVRPFGRETPGRGRRGGRGKGKANAKGIAVTLPEAIAYDTPFDVTIAVARPQPGLKLGAHLHWHKQAGFGGFNAWGGQPKSLDSTGQFTFTFTPQFQTGLVSYTLLVFASPSGAFDQKTSVSIPVRKAAATAVPVLHTVVLGGGDAAPAGGGEPVQQTAAVEGPALKNPQVYSSSFLVEAYLKIAPGQTNGTIIAKADGTAGYALALGDNGGVIFSIKANGGGPTLLDGTVINDGAWHHLIAEADRTAGVLSVYVDGKRTSTMAVQPSLTGSLANAADLVAAKDLACTFDFLRIALGTLADASTTIEELYAWEFDGPQYRDFCGTTPTGARDAGALQFVK